MGEQHTVIGGGRCIQHQDHAHLAPQMRLSGEILDDLCANGPSEYATNFFWEDTHAIRVHIHHEIYLTFEIEYVKTKKKINFDVPSLYF